MRLFYSFLTIVDSQIFLDFAYLFDLTSGGMTFFSYEVLESSDTDFEDAQAVIKNTMLKKTINFVICLRFIIDQL